jgi:hypothetical protein
MKLKSFILLSALIAFLLPSYVHSQDDMDAEVFLGVMTVILSDDMVDELSYQLPWEIRITSYAYGDFSGDGRIDVVVALKEMNVTPDHSVDVYFLENVSNKTYKLIRKQNVRWVELPVEVAFLAKDEVCYQTNRDQSNWYFTGYKIDDDELIQVDREVYPISSGKAGEN